MTTMTNDDKDLIHRTICPGATPDELAVFCRTVSRTGLDPFARQIYWIQRGGKGTIQVSIDGQRSIAERTGELDGLVTDWCGTDAQWVDVWLPQSPPAAARTRVYRKECTHPFVGVSKWDEYNASGPLWRKMPALMLGKCSQAAAYRCAFPLQLSGLYTSDEMAQAENVTPPHTEITEEQQDAYHAWIILLEGVVAEGGFEALVAEIKASDEWLRSTLRSDSTEWSRLKKLSITTTGES